MVSMTFYFEPLYTLPIPVFQTVFCRRILGFHGLKSPRLFNFASFRRHLYTDIIKTGGLKAPGYSCSRLPDVLSFP